MIWWIVFFIVLLCINHYYVTKPFQYWIKRNIPMYIPFNPYMDYINMIFNRISFVEYFNRLYFGYPDKKCYGVSVFRIPQLLIRDPEMIKHITVKDFDHFTDHSDTFMNEDFDEFWGKNIFALKGKRWHDMRSTISPAFTGSKMRGIFELMQQCGKQVATHFLNEYNQQNNNEPLPVEFKEMCSRYANDIIATTAFGFSVDSFKNPTNEFFVTGRQIMNFSTLRFMLVMNFPKLAKLLGVQLMPNHIYVFFRKAIRETLDAREKHNVYRPDFIQLLVDSRKQAMQTTGDSKQLILSDADITGQAFLFFVAGFDTVAVAMSFACYELTVHPDIQQRLYDEIKTTMDANNGEITYESLAKMKYLDMVVSETLRKWPPAVAADRSCTKPYNLQCGDEVIPLERGMIVQLPMFGIHRDARYFENPDKFDPERFSDENKHKIQPFTYFPFGSGPRICVASRFAQMEVKLLIIQMLQNFRLDVIKKTPIPLVLRKKASNLDAEGGFWIGLTPRNKI